MDLQTAAAHIESGSPTSKQSDPRDCSKADVVSPRKCIDCNVDISERGNRAKRCVPCAARHRQEYCRNYGRLWRRSHTSYFREYQRRYRLL